MNELTALGLLSDAERLVDCLVSICLNQDQLDRDASEAELQLALDGPRQASQLESLVANQVARLRERIASGRVEAYFEAHRADFDTAHIARVAFASEAEARAAGELVRAGVLDFYALAEGRFLASARQPAAGASFEVVRSGAAAAENAVAAILLAEHNDVVGPVWDGRAFILALILLHTPARLDASTVTAIEQRLFEQWLDERRAAADAPPVGCPSAADHTRLVCAPLGDAWAVGLH